MLAMLVAFMLAGPLLFYDFDISKNALDSFMSAIYMADYARTLGYPPTLLLHMWSLSIEEHFYLAWPVVLLGLLKLHRRQALVAILLLFAGATIWRQWEYMRVGWMIYHRLDTHASGLLLGCFVGLARWRLPSYFGLIGLTGIAATIVWASSNTNFRLATAGFTAAEISAAMLIMSEPRWLGAAPLAWLGKMSYGIYLWHYPAARVLRQYDLPWEVHLLVISCFGIGLAAISYYTLEAHFRRRKSRLTNRDTDVADVVAVVGARSPRARVVDRV